MELEEFESDHGIPFIAITQRTEPTPAGRMMRRQLAVMASYYAEQQGVDVREGHARRVQSGLFVSTAPYGYRNLRVDGRGLVEVDPDEGANVRRIFEWYAYANLTIDGIIARLASEGIAYCPSVPKWSRAKVHNILRDRAYIGEIKYRGQWHPGSQQPLVDRLVWARVQTLLGENTYKAHELAYAGELIRCRHCGSCITGEPILKKQTGKVYVYYRCVKNTSPGHPRLRLTEANLDKQVLGFFARMKLPEDVAALIARLIQAWIKDRHHNAQERTADIRKQLDRLEAQKARLLDLRLAGEVEGDVYTAKATELRDRIADLKLKLDSGDRGLDEQADIAVKAFELSQRLSEKWLTAEGAGKQRLLKLIGLNWVLDGANLVPKWRKPFDLMAEGLFLRNNRGDKI